MNKRSVIIVAIFFVLGIFILCGISSAFFYTQYPKNLSQCLPSKIDEVLIEKTYTGSEARQLSMEAHRGILDSAEDMIIGYYADDLVLWLSEYEDEETAKSETTRMAKAMPRFGQGFEDVKQIKLDGFAVYKIDIKGSAQYFWHTKNVLVYIIAGGLNQDEIETLADEINTNIILRDYYPLN